MLQKLLDHSPDLQKLVDEGYELEIRGSFALVHHVPYVTASKEIDYGTLVSSLTLNGEATTKPNDHIVGFIGNMPCEMKFQVLCWNTEIRIGEMISLCNIDFPINQLEGTRITMKNLKGTLKLSLHRQLQVIIQ